MILQRELRNNVWSRYVLPAIGFAGLALFVALYVLRADWYFRILWFFFIYLWPTPFLDARYIIAVRECWQIGVDVYARDPCDPLYRLMDYTPLWLQLPLLPTDQKWTNWLGLTLDGLFLISLAWLPRPRRLGALILIILATFSSRTVFALERANMDVAMYVLVFIGALSLEHGPGRRVAGYALMLFAGLLKFYPLVLLLLLVRERLRRFVGLCLAAAAALAWFTWQYSGDVARALRNVPPPDYFGDAFGAWQLPNGLGVVLGLIPGALGWPSSGMAEFAKNSDVQRCAFLLLTATAVLVAGRLANKDRFAAAVAALPVRTRNFLVVGAALIVGCFFADQSAGYRGVLLVFALPGIFTLALQDEGATPALFRWVACAAMFVMWWMTVVRAIQIFGAVLSVPSKLQSITYFGAWLVQEFAWWLTVTAFLAVLFRFLLDSDAWQTAMGTVRVN